ncbi:hypothetical protein N9D08_01550, partial [bacterium]|nr:hypothetical protein [bacterium]
PPARVVVVVVVALRARAVHGRRYSAPAIVRAGAAIAPASPSRRRASRRAASVDGFARDRPPPRV